LRLISCGAIGGTITTSWKALLWQQLLPQEDYTYGAITPIPTQKIQIIPQKNPATEPPEVKVKKRDFIYNAKIGNSSPIVIEKYKLIFFTIQKTGCTVWKQLSRRMMGLEDW
jgi:hypothetical protein